MKNKIKNIDKKDNIKQIQPLDKCVTAAHAEMARNNDDDEPCDDNRS